MYSTSTFILSVLLCVTCSHAKKLPPYITVCHRSDPKLEACILNAVEQIRPHMAEGIPELLIPPMNPLVLPQASLDSGNNFKASFKNIEIFYANEFQIDHLDFDLDKIHLDLSISFPRLRLRSQYQIDGRILILQLQGQGPADGNFTNVSGKISGGGDRYMKRGKEFISVNVNKIDLHLGKPVFQFDDIFRDNKELNDQTNKIINENVVDILDELRPVIDQTIGEFITGTVSRIFNRFSFDELFPK